MDVWEISRAPMLDVMRELRGSASLGEKLGGLHRVALDVLELLPVEVVEKTDDTPEIHVGGIVPLGVVAHQTLEGLSVRDVEGILVVLLE